MKHIFLKLVIAIFSLITVSFALLIPIVTSPKTFFEFPIIPTLEEKARNIFFHVPMAWISVIAFFTSVFYSIKYLIKKDEVDDIKSSSAANLGFIFCVLATITGAIWARFNWGEFWNWDPRQTSIFILLLIYGAYFVLRSAIDEDEKRAKISAVYSIISGLTVPFFVFVMPRIMTGLHPGSLGDASGKGPLFEAKAMATNMRIIFYLSVLSFTMIYFWILNLKARVEVLYMKNFENKN